MKADKTKTSEADANESSGEHLKNIRRRFTNSAGAFSDFVLSRRADEAEHAAAVLTRGFHGREHASALDLACGPGTFVRALAQRIRFAVGVDITPAMLVRARHEVGLTGLNNVSLLCADVNALPFGDESWDMALCTYALHHLLQPRQFVSEMARVVRAGGRVAIVDLVLPDGAEAAIHDQIERIRDTSHVCTLTVADLRNLFRDGRLREMVIEPHQRQRDFDQWMRVAGCEPDSTSYREARRLMEASLEHDSSGFSPRLNPETGALQFIQHAVLLVAEKE